MIWSYDEVEKLCCLVDRFVREADAFTDACPTSTERVALERARGLRDTLLVLRLKRHW